MGIAGRFGLFDEAESCGMFPGGAAVGRFIAGRYDQGDFLDSRAQGFFKQDGEDRLLDAVAVDQRLERKRALAGTGGSDEGSTNTHEDG